MGICWGPVGPSLHRRSGPKTVREQAWCWQHWEPSGPTLELGRTRRWGPGRVGGMLMRVREVVEVGDTSTGGSERKETRAPRGHASFCK